MVKLTKTVNLKKRKRYSNTYTCKIDAKKLIK